MLLLRQASANGLKGVYSPDPSLPFEAGRLVPKADAGDDNVRIALQCQSGDDHHLVH